MTEPFLSIVLGRFKAWKISLSAAPFYASLLVILALAIFIGIFWAINEYQAYQESIENIRTTYEEQYRDRVREELENVVDFIEYTRTQANITAVDSIRNRVQSAYTIASHLYSMYKDEKSVAEIRAMSVEVLRPIRWYGERGYYFAGRTQTGLIDLFADEPSFEGTTGLQQAGGAMTRAVADIIEIVTQKGAGTYRYDLRKPAYPEQVFSQICFVKYFEPLDWFLGAGIYNNDMESMNQAEALARIDQISFGQGGEVFVFRGDGTIISHRDEQLIGRSIRGIQRPDGTPVGERLYQAADSDNQGYVIYQEPGSAELPAQQKLSYIRPYHDWGWVIGVSMHMNEMEGLIAGATQTYRRIAFKNVSTFIFLFSVAVSLLLLVAYYYTIKIKQGFSLFTDFFRQAADAKVKIEKDNLAFIEFEDLAVLANDMVEDRIHKEVLLHRDELRLDTLLQLGMMDNYTLKDKYEFTLQRIVEISRSEEGYMALVNKPQRHVTIISHRTAAGEKVPYSNKRQLSSSVEKGGLPGQAVLTRKPLLCNDCNKTGQAERYPYQVDVRRHLDVPIFNSGQIVLVAGVCNNKSNYVTSDVRQMTMVLEGMWLHILKIRSEKKMGRLERQIIAVREAERSNIGRILHDDLGSHLSGVELLSKALQRNLEKENPQRATQLGSIRELIVDATEKTRRLARGLYPVHIIENGLEAAIEELAVELKTLFGISCELSFNGEEEYIDNNIATHIYYIIREAAFNAARHGKPENIGITMHSETYLLSVQIIDNGSGFNTKSTRRGMGLHTMEYRAKAIGAVLKINSNGHAGTVISVSREITN
jgi:signal transduction histidine kinase